MSTNNAKKKIITFLVITFILSIIFYGLIIRAGGVEEDAAMIYVILLMWSPGVAGLITTFIYQRNLRGMGWGLGKPKYLAIGWLLPVLYTGIIYSAVWLFGLGQANFGALEGNLMVQFLKALTIGVLSAAITAVGEEIGWRGLLVPQMAKINSFTWTAVISGVIWGIWHWPVIWLGYNYPGQPLLGSLFMVAYCIILAYFLAYAVFKSKGVWTAAYLHALNNQTLSFFVLAVVAPTSVIYSFGIGLPALLLGAVVILLLLRDPVWKEKDFPN